MISMSFFYLFSCSGFAVYLVALIISSSCMCYFIDNILHMINQYIASAGAVAGTASSYMSLGVSIGGKP